jgi:hypothetical protein
MAYISASVTALRDGRHRHLVQGQEELERPLSILELGLNGLLSGLPLDMTGHRGSDHEDQIEYPARTRSVTPKPQIE